MKKTQIIEVDNDTYTLIDTKNKKYKLIIEFHDVEQSPQIGYYIYLSESLLDKTKEEYSDYYVFGPLDSPYGKKIENENDKDLIKILGSNNKNIYLKRLYG